MRTSVIPIGQVVSLVLALLVTSSIGANAQSAPRTFKEVWPHASDEVARFVHSSGAYELEHPRDWSPFERGLRTNIGAENGLEHTARGIRTSYGAIVVIVDAPADTLEASTRAIVDNVLRSNTHQRLNQPLRPGATLGGAEAWTGTLLGTSPVTGRGEHVEILCRQYGPGQLLYVLLVSPADDLPMLEPHLKRLAASIKVFEK